MTERELNIRAIPKFYIVTLSVLFVSYPVYATPNLNDVASMKAHADLIWFLMLLFGAGLLTSCLWIFNNMNKNIEKLTLENERLENKFDDVLAKEVFPRISACESCANSICTAHNINHKDQYLKGVGLCHH